jgi:hypothetical protein
MTEEKLLLSLLPSPPRAYMVDKLIKARKVHLMLLIAHSRLSIVV